MGSIRIKGRDGRGYTISYEAKEILNPASEEYCRKWKKEQKEDIGLVALKRMREREKLK